MFRLLAAAASSPAGAAPASRQPDPGSAAGGAAGRPRVAPAAAARGLALAALLACFSPAAYGGYVLAVSADPNGSVAVTVGDSTAGTVTDGAAGLFSVSDGQAVSLVATAAAHYRFAGWLGACLPAGRSVHCALEADLSAVQVVFATFEAVGYELTVSASAGGSVAVSLDSGSAETVAAGSSHAFAASVETSATLEATPATGYRLAGWTGACAGQGAACRLPAGSAMSDLSAGARFEPSPARLRVAAGPHGSVAVSLDSSPAVTVAAGASSEFAVSVETSATLAAAADAHYGFAHWTGACQGQGAACLLPAGSLGADASAAAAFTPALRALSVSASCGGSVSVSVAERPAAAVAACAERSFTVSVETTATLEAAAAAGWRLAGWTGACEGQGAACLLPPGSATADLSAGARFEPVPLRLRVAAGPGGSVAVSLGSSPAETVAAGTSRAFAVTVETSATLTAAPAAGWAFAGWVLSVGAPCAPDAAACSLAAGSLVADALAEAAFAPASLTLTVSASRGGSVAVSLGSSPAETVAAGTSRAFAVTVETSATLAAAAGAHYRFAGWAPPAGAPCAPEAAACSLPAGSLVADASARARFAPVLYNLVVSASAGGSVAVAVGASTATVGPGSARVFAATVEDAVALAAEPAAGWAFAGWALSAGAPCAPDAAACSLPAGSLSADAFALAGFAPVPSTLTVSASRGGSVDVSLGSSPAVTVAAGTSRAFAVTVETSATLAAAAGAHYRFAGWELPAGAPCAPEATACSLPAGSLVADASAHARFGPVPYSLVVSASAGGSVAVAVGGSTATVGPGSVRVFAATVEDAAALVAEPAAGWAFAGWTLSDGLSCAPVGAAACALAAGSVTADAFALAGFAAVPSTLTVSASRGGSVAVSLDTSPAGTVAAGTSRAFAVSAENVAELEAAAESGYALSGWTGACAGEAGEACRLAGDALAGGAEAAAGFAPVPRRLLVFAARGGSVAVSAGGSSGTVGPSSARVFFATVEDAVALVAEPAAGWAFAGWGLAGAGLCGGEADPACRLAAGTLVADAFALAEFAPVPSTLTVSASRGGSVAVLVAGAATATVAAGSSAALSVTVEDAVALAAEPAAGHSFAGWTLSDGLSCAPVGTAACALAAGSVTADGAVSASFAAAWLGPGSVTVSADGATRTAVPHAPGAFVGWRGAPCDGSAQPVCGVSALADGAGAPVAEFRPLVADDIKSLSFGLGYAGPAPDHYQVSLRKAPGAGFVPVLDGIDPAAGAARLEVSAHLLPWGAGSYLTEACDAAGSCAAALGGEGELAQADSVNAVGYFKAPYYGDGAVPDGFVAGGGFGYTIALSADGGTLAAGARYEDSSATGAFAPSDSGWAAAMADNTASISGAVFVYRRSPAGRWAIEAYVKAPNAGAGDEFGFAFALSADGDALAVGAHYEDSSATGAFAPSGAGYQAALDSGGASDSGAVYVYRRDSSGRWAIEAFIKAYVADSGDHFGRAVALSADGGTLAVGAHYEDSGLRAVGDPASLGSSSLQELGYDTRRDSGAVYLYSRHPGGSWSSRRDMVIVKAPNADSGDRFGTAVALSADGGTLAVGAVSEDSSATGAFAPSGEGYQAALDSGGALDSGAAYVYRRDSSGRWAVEAFVKALRYNPGNSFLWFGEAVALSADGATLAVGAPYESSSATGVWSPEDAGWRAALDGRGATYSGAAYVYRRDSSSRWAVEALVKAFRAGAVDQFGEAVALSADGATLAVGAPLENSSATGVFVPFGEGYQAALDSDGASDRGAAYVYHRSAAGRWTTGAFLKSSSVSIDGAIIQLFGFAVALSADGGTLAVGEPANKSHAATVPQRGLIHVHGNVSVPSSGAVYLY